MAVSDERQPLLKDQDRQTTKPDVTPLPWGPISILLLMNALGPLAYELVFPFISKRLSCLCTCRPYKPLHYRSNACGAPSRRRS